MLCLKVLSQLEGMQDSDPNYNQLLGMQNLLQGKNEDGSDKPKGGFMDTLFSGETYEGNSFTESFANMFTPNDGASYVKGQLVDDNTGFFLKPGQKSSAGVEIKGTANSTSNDRNIPSANTRPKPRTTSIITKTPAQKEAEKAKGQKAGKGYVGGSGFNKGGLVNRPKKKSKKNK